MRKKQGKLKIQSLIALIMAFVLLAGIVLTGVSAAYADDDTAGAKEAAEQASRNMACELEAEGLVLLENKNNTLPLEKGTRLNLFGYGSVDPVYGGTGSGASDGTKTIDLIQGLSEAGFEINGELVDFYRNSGVKRPVQSGYDGSDFTPCEVPAEKYTDTLLENAASFSDTVIIVISRIGGEGDDLPQNMKAAGYGSSERSYLELTEDEETLFELVRSLNFERVIVLVNSLNAMELGFLEDSFIDAAIWIGGPGSTGCEAVGQALSGEVNPSGRLTDTYAYDHSSAPAYYNAGSFSYSNLDMNYVEYSEGIYVGYRYYETRFVDNETGLCDEQAYAQTVQYPFGYGLSYTEFEQSIEDCRVENGQITLTVRVENVGDRAGKEVVQVYYTAPYTIGGIEKAHVVLADFEKTELLEPGQSETVTLGFAVEDMASFDYSGYGCYVLEAGSYEIKLMKNAHELIDSRSCTIEETVIYDESNPRGSDNTAAVTRFDSVTNGQISVYVSRADWESTHPAQRSDGKEASEAVIEGVKKATSYESDPNAEEIVFADNGLQLSDMVGLDYDDERWELLLEQLSVSDMKRLITCGGWYTVGVKSIGKTKTAELDGPAGLNNVIDGSQGVAFPAETVIGATWNAELVERFGEVYGDEAAANGINGLYAPGCNIHRTPYSGRSFEYYSEDGLLNGKLAAAEIRGLASKGIYTFAKHFALNDQESNRLTICVWSNEQAMRELYLKPFELAVKEGGTMALMSSYNRIGSTWAGCCKELLTWVLREEWGFTGMVITDSVLISDTQRMDINLALRAGGDLLLSQWQEVYIDTTTNTALQEMRRACHNILYTLANNGAGM